MRSYVFLTFFVFSIITAHGQDQTDTIQLKTPSESFQRSPVFWGHNITGSTEVLPEHQFEAGTYFMGYGINHFISIGTSPWILASYEMMNLHSRILLSEHQEGSTAIDLSFFDSIKKPSSDIDCQHSPRTDQSENYDQATRKFNRCVEYLGSFKYQQTSATLRLNRSWDWDSTTRSILSLAYSYYWNDIKPYSLHMESFNDSKDQITLSSLLQVKIKPKMTLRSELGILGMNYKYPYIHFGQSIGFERNSWYAQIGISATALFQSSQWNKSELSYEESVISGSRNLLTNAIHPEFQLQYAF